MEKGENKKAAGRKVQRCSSVCCNRGLLSNSGAVNNSSAVSSQRVNYAVNNLLDRVSVNGSSLLSLVTTSSERYCYNSGECKYQFLHFF